MVKAIFDTDSSLLRIDNCATRSISPDTSDFISELRPVLNTRVQGVGGKVGNVMSGTIQWQIEDNQGRVHTLHLPNSLYVPAAPSRLLSPQHWAQTAADNTPVRWGTWCATYDNQVILYWDQRRFQRTIPLDQHNSNVASICTAPGYTQFNAFEAQLQDPPASNDDETGAFDAQLVSDDEAKDQTLVIHYN
jgi:hypothetical protein